MIATNDHRPLSLRVSVTDLCSLRCVYCMPECGVRKSPRESVLRFEEIAKLADILHRHLGLNRVRLTGGEPLVRPGIVDLVNMLASQGLDDLAMTTNAQHLAPLAAELKSAGLVRVNVSLDSLRPQRYAEITRGDCLADALRGIDAAISAGLSPVKLNVLVLRGVNEDELVDLARFGLSRSCQVRFMELMPMGPAAQSFDKWFMPEKQVVDRLSQAFELTPLPGPQVSASRDYHAVGGGLGGTIGLISSKSRPFCEGCRRLRLTSTGELVGCIALGKGVSIRSLLAGGSEQEVVKAVLDALGRKRVDDRFTNTSSLSCTGG